MDCSGLVIKVGLVAVDFGFTFCGFPLVVLWIQMLFVVCGLG